MMFDPENTTVIALSWPSSSSATPVFCVVPMSENSRPRAAAAHARPDERESGGANIKNK